MSKVFADILGIVGLNQDNIAKVKGAGIHSFPKMMTLTKECFTEMLQGAGLNAGVVADMVAFRQWCIEFRASELKAKPVTAVFTAKVWDDFLGFYYSPSDSINVEKASSSSVSAETAITTVNNKVQSVAKVEFRLEFEGLPTLPKNETIYDKYDTWLEQFLVHLDVSDCGLTEILDATYVVPTEGNDLKVYLKKDILIKGAMMIATRDTYAYGFVDARKSGRDIFWDVRKAYQGLDYKAHKARKASNAYQELNHLEFCQSSPFGPNAFVAKFMTCLQVMAVNDAPYWPVLKKTTFLDKITHPDYTIWVEVMQNKSDYDFDATTLAFREEASRLVRNSSRTNCSDDVEVKTSHRPMNQ